MHVGVDEDPETGVVEKMLRVLVHFELEHAAYLQEVISEESVERLETKAIVAPPRPHHRRFGKDVHEESPTLPGDVRARAINVGKELRAQARQSFVVALNVSPVVCLDSQAARETKTVVRPQVSVHQYTCSRLPHERLRRVRRVARVEERLPATWATPPLDEWAPGGKGN